MRIAQIAPLMEAVPPEGYGGTERVVSHLVDGLIARGHHVTLFASGDSETSAELVAATRSALRSDPAGPEPLAPHIRELGMVFDRAKEFDVIHSHVDYLAFPAARLSPTPSIHTLHGRLDLPLLPAVFREFGELPLVSISDAQREPLARLGLNWAGTVHHGLPVEEYPFSPRVGRYLAFVGRTSHEKGLPLAIAVSKRAGLPLKIAAKVDDTEREYFEREIRSLLADAHVEFLGEVDEAAKRELMAGALALLFPIDWPEPFGLVMIEALATGTPVITRPRGSVPEVIDSGRTGFIAETEDDLVDAVRRADTIDRAVCRREVETRFSVSHMAAQYEALYLKLIEQPRAA
jgi:glycosyltransferase involved in cell wall biosynthesis